MSQAGILGISTSGIVLTLTGNDHIAVPPTANNINVVGDGTTITVTGNPVTSTLTISALATGASSFPTDSGTAVPVAGVLNVIAGLSVQECGASVSFTGSGNTVELHLTTVDIHNNTLLGRLSGQFLTTGNQNTGLGYGALSGNPGGISGSFNTSIGAQSGFDIASAIGNTCIGAFSLQNGIPGDYNIAIGYLSATNYTGGEASNINIGNPGVAAESNTIRIGTTGAGIQQQNVCFIAGIDGVDLSTATIVTEASDQLGTAVLTPGSGISITPGAGVITIAATGGGVTSITGNTGGAQTGAISLVTANSTPIFAGSAGTITLDFSLTNNLLLGSPGSITSGTDNVGYGDLAAASISSGSANSFIGYESGVAYTTGSNSTAVGAFSMLDAVAGASNNTAIGYASLSNLAGAGTNNTCLGLNSATAYTTTESNNIVIGSTGVIADNNSIRIGTNGTHTSCFITGIDTVNVGSVAKVVTMASDQLGTASITAGTGISVTPGANTITIATTGTTTLTVTPVNHLASPYTVLSTDSFLAVDVSGGVVTIKLPDAPATGRVYYIKDSTGSAATSNVTVTTVGGAVNIDGATSFVMNTAYESISVIFDGTAYEVF